MNKSAIFTNNEYYKTMWYSNCVVCIWAGYGKQGIKLEWPIANNYMLYYIMQYNNLAMIGS